MLQDLTTDRLVLTPMSKDDGALLVELNSDEEVMKYITGRASTAAETADEVAAAVGHRWIVCAREGGEFLGWVGASPTTSGDEFEIGWRFRRSAWGRGCATEAARALVDRLFERGAERVFAQTMAVNVRSRSVMERLGLHHCRTFLLDVDDPLPGTELGEVEYELDRAEWRRRRQ